ncbi:MAG: phosphomannomutase/phosphoglucomutase [Candidatus Magasanikbacteria bacterium]|nr:phosphomannomutase/phosphoglucomutase [Candidatus Magasanikbacteria bacterium]
MSFPRHIFKAYDIRGLVDGELTLELAYFIGRSFVILLKNKSYELEEKKLVVGYDMRPSSMGFQAEVMRGITDEGVDVVDIGLVSTPLFNFACAHYREHAGGIMITASHNPAEYNGFKITFDNGLPLGKETGMDELRDLVEKGEFELVDQKGAIERTDVFSNYNERIFSLVDTEKIKKLKIVVDAGNGMANVSIPKVLAQVPVEVEYLFLEPDGTFPNHEANPLKEETLKDLRQKVLETGADFGFALDGDADRIGLVDEKGKVVPASFVGAMIGLEVLKRKGGGHMLYDLRMSRSVKELWEKNGATTDICPVGHAHIKRMMKESHSIFAAELSLHVYFADMYDVECTDLALLYVLDIMSTQGKKLSEIWEPMNTKFHSGEINFEVEDTKKVLNALKETYHDGNLNELDGVLFTYPDFWFNVRASNTEPVLRLNLEAESKELMEEKVAEIRQIIIA